METTWIDPAISLGAVLLGAVLAWAASYYFEAKRRNNEIAANAFSIFYKLAAFLDDMAKLSAIVRRARERRDEVGLNLELWHTLFDASGFPEARENFSAKELAILTSEKGFELVGKLMEVENSHRIAMASFRRIIYLKYQFHDETKVKEGDGRELNYELSSEEQFRVAPTIINLNDLSRNLDNDIDDFVSNARDVTERFCANASSSLHIKDFPKPVFDDSILS